MTRILVVDDDPISNEMVRVIIAGAGYDIALARDIGEAMSIMDGADKIDIIVSDMHMPGGSGLDLFRHVKTRFPEIGFILLSGDNPKQIFGLEPEIGACLLKDSTIAQTLPAAISGLVAPPEQIPSTSRETMEADPALADSLEALRTRFLDSLPRTLAQAASLCDEFPNISSDKIETLIRLFHGIKGNAASFGLSLISQEADQAEQAVTSFFAMDSDWQSNRSPEFKSILESSIQNITGQIELERAGYGEGPDKLMPALADIDPIRICVLDIDYDNALFNVMLLEQLNFIAEWAGDPEALHIRLAALDADLLLVDVPDSGPGLFAFADLIAQVRIPVLYLAGSSDGLEKHSTLEPGKSVALSKPIDPITLQKVIIDLVGKWPRTESGPNSRVEVNPGQSGPSDFAAHTSELDEILAARRDYVPLAEEEVPEATFLLFTLANDWFAFPGTVIKEVLANTPVFFLPGCPPTIEGVVNIRGDIESVISLRTILGMPEKGDKANSRILLGQIGEISSGLRVDRVEEVVNRRSNEISAPPSHLPKPLASLVSGIFTHGPHLVAILELAKIFSDYSLSSEGI